VITPETCGLNNGQIQGIQVSGGTLPYTQSWTNTAQTALNLTNLDAGSYLLTITDGAGCVATSGAHVIVNTQMVVVNDASVVINDVTCTGNGSITGITVTGAGPATYAWNPSGQTNLNLMNAPAGTYNLTVTDANGCIVPTGPYVIQGTTTLEIDLTSLVVTPSNCNSATGSIAGIQVTGGINPVISWSNNASGLNQNNLASGTYTLLVTDDQGCTDAATIQINLQASPAIQTAGIVLTDAHCGQATGSVSGLVIVGGTPGYQYMWNSDANLNTLDANGLSPGYHILEVTDAAGCIASQMFQIGDEGAPVIDVSNLLTTQAICNEPTGSVSGIAVIGNGNMAYSWTNSTQTILDPVDLPAGNYVLTVTDAFGCTAQTAPITIFNSGVPDAGISFAPMDPKPMEWVQFTDASAGTAPVSWEWTMDGTESNLQNPGYGFPQEGSYPVVLVVTDINGCTDTAIVHVQVMSDMVIPNIVTANNDGANDIWEIKELQPKCHVSILNRWGNLVFETDDYQNDWTGHDASGTVLSAGVYTYYLRTQDGRKFQGFIHLVL